MLDSLLDPVTGQSVLTPNMPQRERKAAQLSGQIYDRLTQTETLNNLLSTFTGVCLIMDETYDMYIQNQLST